MVFVDVAGSVAIGQLAALGARSSLERAPSTLDASSFGHALLFDTLVYLPAVAYFLFSWPALDWIYLVEPSPELNAAFLLAIPGGFVLGFWTTHVLLRRDKHRLAVSAFASIVGLAAGLIVAFWERCTFVATTLTDYELGVGSSFFASDARYTSAIAVGIPVAAFAVFWRPYRQRYGRQQHAGSS